MPVTKTIKHGQLGHEIRLGTDGVWRVRMELDDPDEMSLFESTDCEICMAAIDEVEADIHEGETDDDANDQTD
jgi:hypothetical protein